MKNGGVSVQDFAQQVIALLWTAGKHASLIGEL